MNISQKPQCERMNASINIIIIGFRVSASINRSIYMKLLPRTNQFIKLKFCKECNCSLFTVYALTPKVFVRTRLFFRLLCLVNNWKSPVHIQNMINGRCDCCTVKKHPFTTSLILCLWSTVSIAACNCLSRVYTFIKATSFALCWSHSVNTDNT